MANVSQLCLHITFSLESPDLFCFSKTDSVPVALSLIKVVVVTEDGSLPNIFQSQLYSISVLYVNRSVSRLITARVAAEV